MYGDPNAHHVPISKQQYLCNDQQFVTIDDNYATVDNSYVCNDIDVAIYNNDTTKALQQLAMTIRRKTVLHNS